ncbi:MAG: flavodoxin family protein [Bacillota bacterium]
MLIVGINGSPNKNGNTKLLLSKTLEKIVNIDPEINTVILDVGELLTHGKHSFCTACCNPCSGICYQGTKLEEAFQLLKKADGILMGSPVYFGTVSGQIKAFFDKARKLRGEKALYNKVAAGVTVGASKYGGQETAMKALHDIMFVYGMLIIGDGYFEDDCGHHGVSAQRPAVDDEFALKRTEILAKRMVEVCKATTAIRCKE